MKSGAGNQLRKTKARTRTVKPKAARNVVDPFFKAKLTEAALKEGLEKGPTEIQIPRSTLADMFLYVPSGKVLRDPLLSVMRENNIIEFKGYTQHLTFQDFETQLARVYLWHAQNYKVKWDKVLNVVVTSYFPANVFDYSAERGNSFNRINNQDWLWQARIGWQDVLVVICEIYPLRGLFIPGWPLRLVQVGLGLNL